MNDMTPTLNQARVADMLRKKSYPIVIGSGRCRRDVGDCSCFPVM